MRILNKDTSQSEYIVIAGDNGVMWILIRIIKLDFISEDDSDNWQELSHLETHEAKSIAFPPML